MGQERIADGLRALPVYVMASRYVLVLCGRTYAKRLWCIWELFTLLAFTDFKVALERLVIIPLAEDDCEQLSLFDLAEAHCYDPNEEAMLRKVINAIGIEAFTQRVRALGSGLAKQKMTMPPKAITRSFTDTFQMIVPGSGEGSSACKF